MYRFLAICRNHHLILIVILIKETSFGNPVFQSCPFKNSLAMDNYIEKMVDAIPATKANGLIDLLEILLSSSLTDRIMIAVVENQVLPFVCYI